MNVALKESHVLINPNFLTVKMPPFRANGTFFEFAPKKMRLIIFLIFCHH